MPHRCSTLFEKYDFNETFSSYTFSAHLSLATNLFIATRMAKMAAKKSAVKQEKEEAEQTG
jgi:hypothetical protein